MPRKKKAPNPYLAKEKDPIKALIPEPTKGFRLTMIPVLVSELGNTLAMAFRDCGGIEMMVKLCAMCAEKDERCARIAYIWHNTLIEDREKLNPEEMCRAAEIDPAELLGMLAGAAFRRNIDVSKLMLAVNHPDVLAKTIEFAKKRDGFRDRQLLHQASGFLPTGKGMNINVNQINQQSNGDESDGGMPDFAADSILITSE